MPNGYHPVSNRVSVDRSSIDSGQLSLRNARGIAGIDENRQRKNRSEIVYSKSPIRRGPAVGNLIGG